MKNGQKKRIGIITHYYNNCNYGGNLQAYALCRFITERYDYTVEQITYDHFSNAESPKKQSFKKKAKKLLKKYKAAVLERFCYKIEENLSVRRKALLQFNKSEIPHTEKVYTEETIGQTNKDYDIFITGSDQVWNPLWFNGFRPAYLLNFVDPEKSKLSYAASISKEDLNAEELDTLKTSLSDYKAISVREELAQVTLNNLVSIPVELTVDPTLLLSVDQWNEVCTARLIPEKYVFCYFLGNDQNNRNLAGQFAKEHGLKIVTLPYLLFSFRECDKDFGDVQLYDISPGDFISLIRYAEYVFTDSFHGTVFSILYKKRFYAFGREDVGTMNSRISTLTKLSGQEDRYCSTKEQMDMQYLNQLADKPQLNCDASKLNIMREKSIAFLDRNLITTQDKYI